MSTCTVRVELQVIYLRDPNNTGATGTLRVSGSHGVHRTPSRACAGRVARWTDAGCALLEAVRHGPHRGARRQRDRSAQLPPLGEPIPRPRREVDLPPIESERGFPPPLRLDLIAEVGGVLPAAFAALRSRRADAVEHRSDQGGRLRLAELFQPGLVGTGWVWRAPASPRALTRPASVRHLLGQDDGQPRPSHLPRDDAHHPGQHRGAARLFGPGRRLPPSTTPATTPRPGTASALSSTSWSWPRKQRSCRARKRCFGSGHQRAITICSLQLLPALSPASVRSPNSTLGARPSREPGR